MHEDVTVGGSRKVWIWRKGEASMQEASIAEGIDVNTHEQGAHTWLKYTGVYKSVDSNGGGPTSAKEGLYGQGEQNSAIHWRTSSSLFFYASHDGAKV
jgi:hypothetical protein